MSWDQRIQRNRQSGNRWWKEACSDCKGSGSFCWGCTSLRKKHGYDPGHGGWPKARGTMGSAGPVTGGGGMNYKVGDTL
ncbi:MAG TPA: hypothetical protein VI756_15140, partial [Blastocatellia bacterium]